MRKRILYSILIVLVFFLGISGSYLLMRYYPITTETINKVINKTKIEETAVEGAIEKSYDAVVVVESVRGDQVIATGTGFVYKTDNDYGYILTNNHVISDGTDIVVIMSNGEQVEAKLLGKDSYADIAVMSIPKAKVVKVATIGSTEDVKLGSTVFAIGAPVSTDYSGTVTRGIISGKDRLVTIDINEDNNSDWLMRVVQTDAAINPGNSGGPLVNLAGEVIGITSSKLVDENIEGIGFAIPIEDAMTYVSRLEKGEVIARPVLGVELLDIDEMYALFYSNISIDKNITSGAVIESVISNSAAADAGLKKGDIITKLEDVEINNKAELRYQLYKHNAGDKVKITYYRDGKTKETTATLKGTE